MRVLNRSTVGSGDVQAPYYLVRQLGPRNHQVYFDHRAQTPTTDNWRRVLWSCEMHDTTDEPLYKYFLHAFAREHDPDLKLMLVG